MENLDIVATGSLLLPLSVVHLLRTRTLARNGGGFSLFTSSLHCSGQLARRILLGEGIPTEL